jgi:hypothetical protein
LTGEGIVVGAIFAFNLIFVKRRMVPSGGELVRSFGLSDGGGGVTYWSLCQDGLILIGKGYHDRLGDCSDTRDFNYL